MNNFRLLILAVSVVTLSACSTTEDYKAVYGEIAKTPTLEMPPGLDSPDTNGEVLPEQVSGAKYLSDLSASEGVSGSQAILQTYKDIRFVRDGGLYWLEIRDAPEKIWQDLKAFFNKIGLKIKSENPRLGIMQTEWKENRVDMPSGWLAGLFGKLFSSGLLDSYRIRLENDNKQGLIRVFIAHRGMREAVVGEDNNIDVVQVKWVPRKSDPELETELLMRFMAFRGVEEKVARQEVAKSKSEQRSMIIKQDNLLSLKVNDVFARAWRHVGLALDRMGVLVEDRNRSAGVYYIKLPEEFVITDDSGFFSSTRKPSTDKYLLTVKDDGDTAVVNVKSRGDVGDDFSEVAAKILNELQANIL